MLVFLQALLMLRAAVVEWLMRRLRGTDTPAVEVVEDDQVTAEYDEERGVVFYPPVYAQRYAAVCDILCDPRWCGKLEKVVDLGYHDTSFIKYLKEVPGVRTVLGVDLDTVPLAQELFRSEDFATRGDPLSVTLFHGNAADPDYRLIGCDAVVSIEMVEHMLPHDLERLVHTVFGFIQPWVAVFTTPNADFNVLFKTMLPNGFRHWDHHFEWTREQFHEWCSNIVSRYHQYAVYSRGVGPGPPGTEHLGCVTQLALFVHNSYRKRADLTPDELSVVTKITAVDTTDGSVEGTTDQELNCSTVAVRSFSNKAKVLMDEIKPESLVDAQDVMSDLRQLTNMLNLSNKSSGSERSESIWNNIVWGDNAPYWNQYYTVVKEYEYPIKMKSAEQRILELVSDELQRAVDGVSPAEWARRGGRLCVPLRALMAVVTHFTQDQHAVRELLEWNGYEVTEDVVVYTRLDWEEAAPGDALTEVT